MSETKFEQWANVELMGHQRVVGRCTQEMIAGAPMLRIDIPSEDEHASDEEFTTRYYGSSAIYCITVVSEEVARKLCKRISQKPSFVWDLREQPKAITHSSAPDDDYENHNDH